MYFYRNKQGQLLQFLTMEDLCEYKIDEERKSKPCEVKTNLQEFFVAKYMACNRFYITTELARPFLERDIKTVTFVYANKRIYAFFQNSTFMKTLKERNEKIQPHVRKTTYTSQGGMYISPPKAIIKSMNKQPEYALFMRVSEGVYEIQPQYTERDGEQKIPQYYTEGISRNSEPEPIF